MPDRNAGASRPHLTAIYRYPVKGLSPEPLETVALTPGATLPFDRAYAIENGPGPFDPQAPAHLPKIHFVMLMRNEQLAALKTRFEDATHTLSIRHDGVHTAHNSSDTSSVHPGTRGHSMAAPERETTVEENSIAAQGDLRTASGRAAIEAFITAYMGPALRGPPRVVAAHGHSFSDVKDKCLHIINLESVRALESLIGARLNPLRFRPNLILDGLPAWSEFDLVGKTLHVGPATLEVFKRTERCAATNVDPATGTRDLKIPTFLSRSLGHADFGVYARVAEGGEVKLGDGVG